MKVTIHQPEYLPWLPFFARIKNSDIFVILDDAAYQKNGFINRNKIKTKDGWAWATVPVQGRSPNKKINEVLIDNGKNWAEKQILLMKNNYSASPYFEKYFNFFSESLSKKWERISDLDVHLIKGMLEFLKIKSEIRFASEIKTEGEKTARLVNICKALGADAYLSGPGGKNYMDAELFKNEKIEVIFHEFKASEYSQQFKENGFLAGMSAVDLLFNEGENSPKFLT